VVEPELRGGPPEVVITVAEGLPYLSPVHHRGGAADRSPAEGGEIYPVAVEQPQQVVIPGHQLGGGVGERQVVGQDRRITVAVGTEDGKGPGVLIQTTGGGSSAGVGR
jgi:hypothetical protein